MKLYNQQNYKDNVLSVLPFFEQFLKLQALVSVLLELLELLGLLKQLGLREMDIQKVPEG